MQAFVDSVAGLSESVLNFLTWVSIYIFFILTAWFVSDELSRTGLYNFSVFTFSPFESPLPALTCLKLINFFLVFWPADYGLSLFAKFWNIDSFYGICRFLRFGVVEVWPALPFVSVFWFRASCYYLDASFMIRIWLWAVDASLPISGGLGGALFILVFISSIARDSFGLMGLWSGAISFTLRSLAGDSFIWDISRHMTLELSSRNYEGSSNIISGNEL